MIIAVDFDGTIVEHEFPEIGGAFDNAMETLFELQNAGHKIIIWTCRCGAPLADMVRWLIRRGFYADAINSNVAPVQGFAVPKILADIYIDDRNFGGFPGWQRVREELLPATQEPNNG